MGCHKPVSSLARAASVSVGDLRLRSFLPMGRKHGAEKRRKTRRETPVACATRRVWSVPAGFGDWLQAAPSLGWLPLAAVMLDSSSCARVAQASRLARAGAVAVASERIEAGLCHGALTRDVVKDGQPLLALSHLESLANSVMVFRVLREALRSSLGEGAWLLEVSGALCDAIFKHVLEGHGSAPLSALLRHFDASRYGQPWSLGLLAAILRRSKRPAGNALVIGKDLGQFLLGAGELLPTTAAAMAVIHAAGPARQLLQH